MTQSTSKTSVRTDFVRIMGVTAAVVAVALWLFHWHELDKAEAAQTRSDSAFLKVASDSLQRELLFPVQELDLLAGSHALTAYGKDPSAASLELVKETLVNTLRSAGNLDQVRLIGAKGFELVRVDKRADGPRVAPQDELQDKSQRDYFKNSIPLGPDELYISKLDLNVEHGEIEVPHKPMIRFATPVDNAKGERLGIVVLNVLAQDMLERLARMAGRQGELQLLNEEGSWLYNREEGLAWGFMFPDGPSLAREDPDAWQAMHRKPHGTVRAKSGLFTFATVQPFKDLSLGGATAAFRSSASRRSWTLLSAIPNSAHRAAQLSHARVGGMQWLLVIVMLAPGAWIFASTRSKQAAAAEELARSERHLAALTESVPDAILTVDEREKIVAWNRAANELFALQGRDITGMPLSWLLRNTEPRGLRRLLSMPQGETREMLGLHPNGDDFPIEVAAGHWTDSGVQFTSIIARDTSKRHEAERQQAELQSQLAQAQKLESVGQLASGIAHEINTPTQFVGDNTRFLRESFDDVTSIFSTVRSAITDLEAAGEAAIASQLKEILEEADVEFLEEEIPKALEQSIAGLDRVARIVRAMKEFAHPGQETMAPADLNQGIESTVTVATNEWKYACELHLDLDKDLPQVTCHAGEINQAVLNMIVNASHAVADRLGEGATTKGNIWVSTRRVDDWAEIRIRDDGAGIPEEARAKIFDPFFTTKEVGRGSGQGLAIAHNVVTQKHGGTLDFETELGVGTTFILRIPLSARTKEELKT